MARDDFDDERVVVIERDRGGANGVGMLLLGLAIGAGAALLLAPASGRETRERLSDGARRATRKVRDMADELGEEFTDAVGHARERVDAQVGRAKDAVGSRVQAVNDAVSAGREAALQARQELERAVADGKRAYADSRRTYAERTRRPAEPADRSAGPEDAADGLSIEG